MFSSQPKNQLASWLVWLRETTFKSSQELCILGLPNMYSLVIITNFSYSTLRCLNKMDFTVLIPVPGDLLMTGFWLGNHNVCLQVLKQYFPLDAFSRLEKKVYIFIFFMLDFFRLPYIQTSQLYMLKNDQTKHSNFGSCRIKIKENVNIR